MIEYARYAMEFCEGVAEEDFVGDRKLVFAVTRAVEVVGEAVRSIPDEVRALAPEVPWSSIVRTRNRIAHHYFGVKLDIVWNIVQKELPTLIESMTRVLAQLEAAERGLE